MTRPLSQVKFYNTKSPFHQSVIEKPHHLLSMIVGLNSLGLCLLRYRLKQIIKIYIQFRRVLYLNGVSEQLTMGLLWIKSGGDHAMVLQLLWVFWIQKLILRSFLWHPLFGYLVVFELSILLLVFVLIYFNVILRSIDLSAWEYGLPGSLEGQHRCGVLYTLIRYSEQLSSPSISLEAFQVKVSVVYSSSIIKVQIRVNSFSVTCSYFPENTLYMLLLDIKKKMGSHLYAFGGIKGSCSLAYEWLRL